MREHEAREQAASPTSPKPAPAQDLAPSIGNRAFSALVARLLARSPGLEAERQLPERYWEPSPPTPTPPSPTPAPTGALQPGDHVWEWNGLTSQAIEIPRKQWFKGSANETDYKGHGWEIFEYVIYADHVKRGQPHMRSGKGTFAWLNNNPGNLTASKVNLGEFPGKRNWHNFIIFPTREAGFDAIPKFLKVNNYGPLSIKAAIKRYAPKGDGRNNPDHYAKSIVDALGGAVTLETKIQDLTPDQMLEVQKAIAKMEGAVKGTELPRSSPEIPQAIRARL